MVSTKVAVILMLSTVAAAKGLSDAQTAGPQLGRASSQAVPLPYHLAVAAPTADQDPGLVRIGAQVRLSSPTANAIIRFTTDGSTPSCTSGDVYAGSITISSSVTLKAIACAAGYNDSGVLSLAFAVRPPVTRYISASGSDGNNGATPATSWAHMPGQTGCAASCAAAGAVVGGDQYLFKRGDSWTGSTVLISHAGDYGANIIVSAYGDGRMPLLASADNQPLFHSIGVNRGYWTIDGLDLHATGHVPNMHGAITIFNDWFTGGAPSDTPQPGWIIQNCHSDGQFFLAGDPIVRDCVMEGTNNHGTEHENGAEGKGGGIGAAAGAIIISGNRSSGARIYNNTVFNWTGRGIWIADGAHNAVIHDNLVHDVYSWDLTAKCWCAMGIDLDGAGTPEDGNIVYNNDLSNFFGQGIALENQTHALVYGNKIHNTRAAAIGSVHYDGSYGTYDFAGVPANNVVYGNVMWNVWSCGGTGGEPYSSWVHNTCVAGHNTFAGIGDTGYRGVPDANGWTVSANDHHQRFVNNIVVGFACPVSARGSAAWTQFDYNDLVGTGSSVYCENGSGKTLAQTRDLGLMIHGISADPLFADPPSGNYTLKSNSPAAGRGAALAAPLNHQLIPSTDFPWSLQPQGANPNMGAFGPRQ